jgi:ADP-ribosylglycohydrolase
MPMKRLVNCCAVLLAVSLPCSALFAAERTISREELHDKIWGYWLGQLVGNYMGFPFENVYQEEPVPVLVDRYYDGYRDAGTVRMNDRDARGYPRIFATATDGAWSDDDTDIEFVTLHAVEKYGLDIDYAEITDMWKRHINRRIWVANRTARDLMDEGLMPPETGMKENNQHWFQIDPQLVNEIWSVFYPGMIDKAVERAEWGARITSDDWGTHPTIAYAVMYSAAFFEDDVEVLVRMALERIPPTSPFAEGVRDLLVWHEQHEDWRTTRQLLHDKYYRYTRGDYQAPVSPVSSLINGLAGVMAILYGDGDFVRTTGIAVSAGYDNDNQGATCAGLIGVMHGAGAIPDRFTKQVPWVFTWEKPFNDLYINYTRDNLPLATKISDIVDRIAAITELAIWENGGRKTLEDGREVLIVQSDF